MRSAYRGVRPYLLSPAAAPRKTSAATAVADAAARIQSTTRVVITLRWWTCCSRVTGDTPYGQRMPSRLVVKVTCGAEAAERCAQGFTVASVALASGASVSLWLTGEA